MNIENEELPNEINSEFFRNNLRRLNSEATTNILIRILDLRDRHYSELLEYEHDYKKLNYFDFFFSNSIATLIPFIIAFLFIILAYLIASLRNSEVEDVVFLEADSLWIPYIVLTIIFGLAIWLAYFVFIKQFDPSLKQIDMKYFEYDMSEFSFFTPLYTFFLIYIIEPNHLVKSFDFMFLALVSFSYFVNYIYTIYMFNASKTAISKISNLCNPNNNKINRIRLFSILLIIANVLSTIFFCILLDNVPLLQLYIINFKVFPLFN